MRYLKLFEDFFLENVSLEKNNGVLFIIDVQNEFKKFIPKYFLSKLKKYCNEFDKVYQIWDSNKTKKPTYKFPKQVSSLEKQFGVKKYYKDLDNGFEEWIFDIFDKKIADNILKLLKRKEINEGDKFKLKNKEEYLVYINNEHKWFFVNSNLVKVFKSLKNKSIVMVGGAGDECIRDIYISSKSFGVRPIYNHEYIYDATYNKFK